MQATQMKEKAMKKNLRQIAFERRADVLDMIFQAKAGHLGGDMSCMDILVCLYYEVMDIEKLLSKSPDRDRFVLSKGHNAEALYTVLADRGFFPKDMLKSYARLDTILAQHPTPKIPGVEAATGSLGHGLSLGVGLAMGLMRDGRAAHVYVLMGDGEQAEGSVWEAAMAAGKYGLEQLTAIVDRNGLQISGGTEQVMPLEDLRAKYQAFGWHVVECDGHSSEELCAALRTRVRQKPVVVLAKTCKGYGSPVTAGQAIWHHKVPSLEEYEQIRRDLTARRA